MDDVAERLNKTADILQSEKTYNRREVLKKLAAAGGFAAERAYGAMPNIDVLSANETLTYPFAGLDRGLLVRALQADFDKEDGRAKADTKKMIDRLASSNDPFVNFAYGNPTPYGDGAMRIYKNIRPSFQDKGKSDEYADKGLLVAPNLFYFNPDLRRELFAARDEALAAAGMSVQDLKNGSLVPEKLFSNAVQRRYNEIDAIMRSMRGEEMIFTVVKPADGSYFMEGPYWKANSKDLEQKSYWNVQYARPVIVGDVKSAFHMYNCTPELTGLRENNFLADIMPDLYSQLKPFRNNNHRPLCLLIKP